MDTEGVDEDHQDGANGNGRKHAMIVVLLGRHDVAADDKDQEKGPERLCDEPGDAVRSGREAEELWSTENTNGSSRCLCATSA
jgi:hypothetical protein